MNNVYVPELWAPMVLKALEDASMLYRLFNPKVPKEILSNRTALKKLWHRMNKRAYWRWYSTEQEKILAARIEKQTARVSVRLDNIPNVCYNKGIMREPT